MSLLLYTPQSHDLPEKHSFPKFWKIIFAMWGGLLVIFFLFLFGLPRWIINAFPCWITKNCEQEIILKNLPEKTEADLTKIVHGAADQTLTRGQMIIYLKDIMLEKGLIDQEYIVASLGMGTVEFKDILPVHPAYTAAKILSRRNIIKGKENKLNPDQLINRAEAVAMIVRGLELPLVIEDGAPHFTDVKTGAWFYRYAETLYSRGALREAKFLPGEIATEGFLQKILGEL